MPGNLYLIPNSLGSSDPHTFLPREVRSKIISITCFIVEDLRNARRYLKSLDRSIDIDSLTFFELNKHTLETDLLSFLQPSLSGVDTGILSEAGLPGIADPGSKIVLLAHKHNIEIRPLTGPSSIFMALMASGMNGQRFRFCGYLPINNNERIEELRRLEKKAIHDNETQIFIETPYRNQAILDAIINTCKSSTLLTIATDISTENEFIKTRTIAEWNRKKPDLHKRPTVYLLGY